MKKIGFLCSVIVYSLLLAFVINPKVDIVMWVNVIVFGVSIIVSCLIVRFFTVILENRYATGTYFILSELVGQIFIGSMFLRLLVIYLNLKMGMSKIMVVSVYLFVHALIFILIEWTATAKKSDQSDKLWHIKNVRLFVPFILYLVIDVISFWGGLK